MSRQETLILVKPDGVKKGLLGEILRDLRVHGIDVQKAVKAELSPDWVRQLYINEREEPFFHEVVAWIISGPVYLLLVSGVNAVDIVKYTIIGKYPDGIRGRCSEDRIRNVAHAPDSERSARREIMLAEPIFARRLAMQRQRFSGKMVFALTGMSECGKSTVGKYLDSRGIPRLKIVRLFERVRDKQAPNMELQEFVRGAEQRDPIALWDAFIDELFAEMDSRGVSMASLESLYGGGLGPYLRQQIGEHFAIVYIEASPEKRIELQMIRLNLTSRDEATRHLLPRDEVKAKSGIPELKLDAEVVIENSGTLDDLYAAVDEMVRKYRP